LGGGAGILIIFLIIILIIISINFISYFKFNLIKYLIKYLSGGKTASKYWEMGQKARAVIFGFTIAHRLHKYIIFLIFLPRTQRYQNLSDTKSSIFQNT
jgi:energy-coupling factor transporter transmembrane protein EcfT